jgi:hypothetical protein
MVQQVKSAGMLSAAAGLPVVSFNALDAIRLTMAEETHDEFRDDRAAQLYRLSRRLDSKGSQDALRFDMLSSGLLSPLDHKGKPHSGSPTCGCGHEDWS